MQTAIFTAEPRSCWVDCQSASYHLNALSPVTAWPRTSECTSCVPSYVYTLSRFAMCRIAEYSARMPFAPSSRRASRAMSVAMLTLFRLASDTCCGVNVPGVLQAAEVQRHELRLHDLGEHVGQPLLLNLESADRPVEHHALSSSTSSASSKHAIAAPIAPHEMP